MLLWVPQVDERRGERLALGKTLLFLWLLPKGFFMRHKCGNDRV